MSNTTLDKVRKLLAKAEDPGCTAAEAAAFTGKAAELIAKYGVDRALLAARDPATDAVGDRLERVELLFTSLLVQAAYGLATVVPPRYENVAAFRRSWLAGFAGAVSRRLREAEQRAATAARDEPVAGASMTLVLADRSGRVARRVTEVYPRLQPVGPRRLAGSGLRAGMDAGHRADLGGARVSTSRRAPALGR